MLTGQEVISMLFGLATGHPDRSLNVLSTSDVDEELKRPLWAILSGDLDPSERARAIGDELLARGADQVLINECYRASFYLGGDWAALAHNPLFAQFTANKSGAVLDKWVHYFPAYDAHLSRFRGKAVKVLEIGVYRGGGLAMLAEYLGPQATLVGLDIDQAAVDSVHGRFPVELGDQEDPAVLGRLNDLYGPFDIIIDDGGHTMRQQIVTVETMFPMLNEDGVLIVEDCHTSYWPEYGGDLGAAGSFIEWAKSRVDDLHSRHDPRIDAQSVWATHLDAAHFYDSVVVLDKKRRFRAFNEVAGTSSYVFADRFSESIAIELVATRAAALDQVAQLQAELARLTGSVAPAARAHAQAPVDVEDIRVARSELERARADLAALGDELDAQRVELDRTRNQLLESWSHVQDLRRTVSWRVTSPLRSMRRLRGRQR